MKTIPIIDWRFEQDCMEEMYDAYTTCGFAVFTHVYDEWLSEFQDWKLLMEEFFQLGKIIKGKYGRLNGEHSNRNSGCN